MTPPGSAGTASDGFRVPKPEGRHRAPPLPPKPPKAQRLLKPIAALAAFGIGAPPLLLAIIGFATAVAPDARAAGVRGVTASTAERTARTAHVPLTILPVPATSMSTATPSAPREAQPTWGGATASAKATQKPAAGLSAVSSSAPTTTDQPPTTLPTTTTTTTTAAVTTTAAPPASTTATSSAPTSTEENPVIEPTQTTAPTDVIGDALDEVVGETP